MLMNNELLQDIAWSMRVEAKKSLGSIDWDAIALKLYREGYVREKREKRDIRHTEKDSRA